MASTPIPIITGEGRSASKYVSNRTLVNCYIETLDGVAAIFGGPGYTARQTLAGGPIRGLHNFNETLLATVGNNFYTVTEGGTATNRGTILGVSAVSIEDNGAQAVIVAEDEEKSYVWDGSALSLISDPDLYPLSSVAFVDQYMAGSVKNTGRFQISALADATDWSALDVATAEARPDKLRRVFVDNRDLLLCGEKTIEGQYNSGAADFPFSRSQLFLELGLAGRDAIASVDNSVAFLAAEKGGGYTVRIIRGATPIIISTPAITTIIEAWSDPGLARAFAFSLRNHQFWALRHPDGCVVWDASAARAADAWHVRKSYGSETWAPAFAVNIWGSTILGAGESGKLFTLDAGEHTEADNPLVRRVQTGPLGPGSYFTLNELELMIEPGVGQTDDADPKVWMELSRNGGKTWGARMERRIGARGDYDKRIVWDGGFGQFRPEGGVVAFGMSDDAPFVVKGAGASFTVDQ